MNKGQIRRLIKVIVATIIYVAASLWFQGLHTISDNVMNWILSFLFPVFTVGIILIVVLMVWEICEKIRDYIIG